MKCSRLVWIALPLALVALSGCVWPFESDDYQDRLAGIWEVTMPDTVDVGSTFDVAMMSSGANGCWKKGRDVVVRSGALQATITPYDQEYIGDGLCTADVPTFTHVVSLNATARGAFEVNVKSAGGVIERMVTVR